MKDPWESHRVLQLSTSLQQTKKSIMESRRLLHSPLSTSSSTYSHNNLILTTTDGTQLNLKLSINLQVASQESTVQSKYSTTQQQHKTSRAPIHEKPFAKIGKQHYIQSDYYSPKLNFKIQNDQYQNNFQNKMDKQKQFSFGDSDEKPQPQKLPHFSLQHEGLVDQGYPFHADTEAIKIIDNDEQDSQVEPVSDKFQTPKKQIVLDQQQYQTCEKRVPKKQLTLQLEECQSYFEKTQAKTQRFAEIRRKIKIADFLMKESMQNNSRSRQVKQQRNQKNQYPPKINTRKSAKSRSSNIKTQLDEQQGLQQKRQRKNSAKIRLLNYFFKSPSRKKISSSPICEKYQRQIQRDKREKYIKSAFKIPGISHCLTMSEVQDLYQSFRTSEQPQYKWIEYIYEKMKSSSKMFTILPTNNQPIKSQNKNHL